jgi:hypothetical protein
VKKYVKKISLILTFIANIYNVIKKHNTIEGKGFCKNTRLVGGNDGGFDGKDG